MKIKFIVSAILLFTFFGCCDECKKDLKAKTAELNEAQEELEVCRATINTNDTNEIFLPVSLHKKDNNKFQLVHIEGRYGIPFLILAKFKTGDPKNGKCAVKSVKLKIQSVDGEKYIFEKQPTITLKEGKIYANVKVVIGTDTQNRERVAKIPVKITGYDEQIFDVHFEKSETLNEHFKDFNEDDIAIFCCDGVICKSKLQVPNP